MQDTCWFHCCSASPLHNNANVVVRLDGLLGAEWPIAIISGVNTTESWSVLEVYASNATTCCVDVRVEIRRRRIGLMNSNEVNQSKTDMFSIAMSSVEQAS